LLVLAFVLIDARAIKNLQFRASKRIVKRVSGKIEPWCTVDADVKTRVTGEKKCEFSEVCVKGAVATSTEDVRCGRLAGLDAATAGLGEAGLGVRDMYLVSSAAALVKVLGAAPVEEAKIKEAVDKVFGENFGTAANAGAAGEAPAGGAAPAGGEAAPEGVPVVPPVGGEAPDAAGGIPPPAFAELNSEDEPAAAAPPPAEGEAAAPPPAEGEAKPVENPAAPCFCTLSVTERLILTIAWMGTTPPLTPETVLAKAGSVTCPAGVVAPTAELLNAEITALTAKEPAVATLQTTYFNTNCAGLVAASAAPPPEGGAAAPAPEAAAP